ncbi:hypothetical protein EMIHUDRAFT_125376, partial [Emiliania huxleyi CCMP1516]|uniref:ANK_REP_REGION domain-containing protein n=2 Tax=Emiliania huxleyi TaxID=2903 RepID=A0A0D3HZN9_EMIH1
ETPRETAIVWSFSRRHLKCALLLREHEAEDAPPPLSDKYIAAAMARLAAAALPSELLSAYMRAGSALGDVGMIKNLAAAPTSLALRTGRAQPDLVNVPDATGRTALHAACENGH